MHQANISITTFNAAKYPKAHHKGMRQKPTKPSGGTGLVIKCLFKEVDLKEGTGCLKGLQWEFQSSW